MDNTSTEATPTPTACAHMRVSYRTEEDPHRVGHVIKAWWECDAGCGARFGPTGDARRLAVVEEIRDRHVRDAHKWALTVESPAGTWEWPLHSDRGPLLNLGDGARIDRTRTDTTISHHYGSSDDLVEVDGPDGLGEEFNPRGDGPGYLAFSEGTLLSIEYTDTGFWRINRLVAGSATYTKRDGTDESTDYSDHVELVGDIRWVTYGHALSRIKEPRDAQ